jgi:hypothetical protein
MSLPLTFATSSRRVGSRGTRRKRGSIFIDVLTGVFILAFGAAALFALFPVFKRSEKISRYESSAAQMASRMIEHIQLLKPTDINADTLADLNLIDTEQAGQPLTFTTIPLDDGSGYSPAQALPSGQGLLWYSDLSANSKFVAIEIRWTSPSGSQRSFRTGTVLGGHR